MLKILITSGDLDGIGLEVSIKALNQMGPQAGYQFFLMRGSQIPPDYVRLLSRRWNRKVYKSLDQALVESSRSAPEATCLYEIDNFSAPPFWVVEAAKACLADRIDGLCTAPLSKALIRSVGLKDRGHTEIFKRLSGRNQVNMAFVGKYFNVVLVTDHIALSDVSSAANVALLKSTIENALDFRSCLSPKMQGRPLALLGLNPHSGEGGLIGREEASWGRRFKRYLADNKVAGPLPPDVAFLKKNWPLFSVFVATYHDQGLIPFKMAHGQDSGAHISLGLPFVRTSVDHGTAKDLFGSDCANPNSMIEAINWCKKLSKQRIGKRGI